MISYSEVGAFALMGVAVGGISMALYELYSHRLLERNILAGQEDEYMALLTIRETFNPPEPIEERRNPEYDPEHPNPGVPEKLPADLLMGLDHVAPNEPPEETQRRHRHIKMRAAYSLS